MSGFAETIRADQRLVILRLLKQMTDSTLNDSLLQKGLGNYGHSTAREVVRDHVRYLERLGAVTFRDVEGVLIVTLTQRGEDHVERRIELEGVNRPSLTAS